VEGWVEYFQWSPDGSRILLGVAGHGADVAGGQGAISSRREERDHPTWIPVVDSGDESFRWRHLWIYDLATDRARRVGRTDLNIWEGVWCGSGALIAVVSPGPGEGLWYTASLRLIDLNTGRDRELYVPRDQIGLPGASSSGRHLSIIEAVCSDRGIVAGELRLIDTAAGTVRVVDTRGADITCCEWRSEDSLLIAGHRSFDTVVGRVDAVSGTYKEVWGSRSVTGGGRFITVSGINDSGDCAFVGESFSRSPEVALVREGEYRVVRCLDPDCAQIADVIGSVETVSWPARDGLTIEGWMLLPKSGGSPPPVIMNVHGGPVWHWHPLWLSRAAYMLMLLARGYAFFLPNPRGSTGRGQDFVRHVQGDLGGADAQDLLAGLDFLVTRKLADPRRLGVMGTSYGGFMTSWLITQDARFAAALPIAPHTNQVTEHLMSNIPHFLSLFLADRWDNPNGRYFERSPIMHARRARTPTLNVCGALDRCTPPAEAMQFHSALLENGVKSVLVTYPEEGHGVRRFPALVDFTARTTAWFTEQMPI
jgi:dipeptidyl aminopeptidase/acylaminoacyl peptidase